MLSTAERIAESHKDVSNSLYFSSKTSEEKIQLMHDFCDVLEKELQKNVGVDFSVSCWLDDWGRFDNFQFFLKVKQKRLTKYPKGIAAKVKKIANNELSEKGMSEIKMVSSPSAVYSTSYNVKYFEGYDTDIWGFDLNF